ncbi:MAG TPA: hypothetical protein VNH65_07475 [Candidatus Acidoferrum sp.]|nr:hypothetical protein [Candidatus Acidoferrum sp.]
MKKHTHPLLPAALVALCAFLVLQSRLHAQVRQEPGKSIGKVSTVGDVILLELDEGILGEQNLFDLNRRTVRFTRTGSGYRVENLPLQWDAEFGDELKGSEMTLRNMKFPFSGRTWDSFSVGGNGSIRFGGSATDAGAGLGAADRSRGEAAERLGGVQIGRFDQLGEAAETLINTVPAICVFMKPRMYGDRYAKELDDRVVVTWDVTEPWGNIQDFTWSKTVNKFQAVLHQDGTIDMSYDQLAAKDAIVGVYPLVSTGTEKAVATIVGAENPTLAPNLNLRNVKLAAVDDLFLRVTFETRGPVLQEGDPGLSGIAYHLRFNTQKRPAGGASHNGAGIDWSVRGFVPRNRAGRASARYFASGPGLSRSVTVSGNTISIQGMVPAELRGARQVFISADAVGPGSDDAADHVPGRSVALTSMRSPEVDFSSSKPLDGTLPIVYEAFHYYPLPNSRDLACTVLKTLGDKFDFLAYYSDFRIDNQEAGTPSYGPLGSTGAPVTGIGATQRGLESFCSQGRFQWQFVQPVYVGANQMQEQPPDNAPVGSEHDITFFKQQLSEIAQNGKMPAYMYAMSQIAHEMGHRWGAFVSAKVNGETIPLGPTHWARGLQAPVAFPFVRPTEASIMGGGVWQDNFDGTFTQLDDDYYVPATGWSYLDLYLMGLVTSAEVPDFFILRNLMQVGKDSNGRPIFKADRTKVSIQDVMAAEGPRAPEVDRSQRNFNTGMVMVVEHGKKPSPELLERTEGIRKRWIEYWPITTGQRASMTATPR